MQKYVCQICGFIYDEKSGYPEDNIAPNTLWKDIPSQWVCPLCGATKEAFKEKKDPVSPSNTRPITETTASSPRTLSAEELRILFLNLSKGCEKQYLSKESELFLQLANFYLTKTPPISNPTLSDFTFFVKKDLDSYENANQIVGSFQDRGGLRSLVWSEKVTKIIFSLLNRYQKQQEALLENKNVFVCEICGFIYVGDVAPAICPVCKVPNSKIKKVKRG